MKKPTLRLGILVAALAGGFVPLASAQGGDVAKAAGPAYNPQLDPDGDGFITADGQPFTSGTTEAAEFELPTHAVGTAWNEIFDISEAGSDITPNCSSTDIVTDDDGGGIGYWLMTDPTPTSPRSGDEHLVLRMRLAARGKGNFGFNFLLSTDGLYGNGVDGNALAGNQGFEYEIQFSSGGGNKGVSGWDVDGLIAPGTLNCAQCISVDDVQKANAASAGGCPPDEPTFITLAYELSRLPAGLTSDVEPIDLFIALATAKSGNGGSILNANNVADYGAFNNEALPPDCGTATGSAQFDCLMEDAFEVQQAALPVTLIGFTARRGAASTAGLTWQVAEERELAGYAVERSADGRAFDAIGFVAARANDRAGVIEYRFTDRVAPRHQTAYYRLVAVDLDGSSEYSPIVALSATPSASSTVGVYPNPAMRDGTLRIELAPHTANIHTESRPQLTLSDTHGRTVRSQALSASVATIDLAGLPAGLYQLVVADGTERLVSRVIVR